MNKSDAHLPTELTVVISAVCRQIHQIDDDFPVMPGKEECVDEPRHGSFTFRMGLSSAVDGSIKSVEWCQ